MANLSLNSLNVCWHYLFVLNFPCQILTCKLDDIFGKYHQLAEESKRHSRIFRMFDWNAEVAQNGYHSHLNYCLRPLHIEYSQRNVPLHLTLSKDWKRA